MPRLGLFEIADFSVQVSSSTTSYSNLYLTRPNVWTYSSLSAFPLLYTTGPAWNNAGNTSLVLDGNYFVTWIVSTSNQVVSLMGQSQFTSLSQTYDYSI